MPLQLIVYSTAQKDGLGRRCRLAWIWLITKQSGPCCPIADGWPPSFPVYLLWPLAVATLQGFRHWKEMSGHHPFHIRAAYFLYIHSFRLLTIFTIGTHGYTNICWRQDHFFPLPNKPYCPWQFCFSSRYSAKWSRTAFFCSFIYFSLNSFGQRAGPQGFAVVFSTAQLLYRSPRYISWRCN